MLEMIYQISLLGAYSGNVSKRFIKSPKVFLTDSGMFYHLLGISDGTALSSSPHKGEVVETFVYSELLKHISYAQSTVQIYHYRTNDKKEIDFILQRGDTIFAIEVKSAQSIKKEAFKHIIDFQVKSKQTVVGIVLYGGEDIISFGDERHQRYAVPLAVFF